MHRLRLLSVGLVSFLTGCGVVGDFDFDGYREGGADPVGVGGAGGASEAGKGGAAGTSVSAGAAGKTGTAGKAGAAGKGGSAGKGAAGGTGGGHAGESGFAGSSSEGGAAGKTNEGGAAGKTNEGGAAGTTNEGGAAGNTNEGGAAGTTNEGGAAGNTSEGGAAGNTSEGGAAGNTSEGGAAGTTSEGGAAGNTSEGGAAGNTSGGGGGAAGTAGAAGGGGVGGSGGAGNGGSGATAGNGGSGAAAGNGSGGTGAAGAAGAGGQPGCQSGTKSCNGTCVSTSDPAFGCSANDCAPCTGTCASGVCQAWTTLATQQKAPRALAVDATHVYWSTSDKAVRRVNKTGGSVQTLGNGYDTSFYLATDANAAGFVVWPAYFAQTLYRFPKDAAGIGKSLAVDGYGYGLAIDGDDVFFATDKPAIFRVSLSSFTSPTLIATPSGGPTDVRLDATYVYWSTDNGKVERARRDVSGSPPAPTVLVSGAIDTLSFAINASSIFYSSYNSSTIKTRILMAPIAGGAGVDLGDGGPNGPGPIVADEVALFWSRLSGSNVIQRRVLATGATGTVSTAGGNGVDGIAIDATRIFYGTTAGSSGIIYAVPR